ncbi:MAG: magnesium/cobalt transporter CorA [Acidobacteria bacterium]|nr:magnesium/cobalt transporter CorA [Acidobacteriota bacterium]
MMKKILRRFRPHTRFSTKAGMSPGTLMRLEELDDDTITCYFTSYSKKHFDQTKEVKLNECTDILNTKGVGWLEVEGLSNTDALIALSEILKIHPLVIEDIQNTEHGPKFEGFEDYIFILIKSVCYDSEKKEANFNQWGFILMENLVVSFVESKEDLFSSVKKRLENPNGRMRNQGPDALLHTLLDIIVDNYFIAIEKLGDELERIEDDVLDDSDESIVREIHQYKRELVYLRRSLWPLRDVVRKMTFSDDDLLTKNTRLYWQDLQDHIIQVIDLLELYRDMISNVHDLSLSIISNRMNQVMKVLTIFATIFIPLTFIAGIYGMNFDFMPELRWKWGYFGIWGVFIAVTIGMIIYFKRKKWF